jgi:hypothetical protein
MSNNQTTSSGLGISTILFLIFLTLKLTNNIDWSWWWVFSPFWIPMVIFLFVFIIIFLFGLVYIAHTGRSLESFIEKFSKKS